MSALDKIIFNHESDRTDYPLADWQKALFNKIVDHFKLQDQQWVYQATIHGCCFWIQIPEPIPHFGRARLHIVDLKFLGSLEAEGLRWFEPRNCHDHFAFSIKHKNER